MRPARKGCPQSLFGGISLETPHITEVRRLLQMLQQRSVGMRRQIYMITSAGRGEGKSTITGLLAFVAARIFNKRTVVVDGDLHRPMLHLLMGLTQAPGLFEYMHGRATIERVARPTPVPTLRAITAGHVLHPMGDAYHDGAFRDLLAGLREESDLIFVDSAPIVPVIEPTLMAEHVDAILTVVMAGRTSVPAARRLRRLLEPLQPKLVGAIVNNASRALPYYYEYRYYGYEPERRRRTRVPDGAKSTGAASGTPAEEGR